MSTASTATREVHFGNEKVLLRGGPRQPNTGEAVWGELDEFARTLAAQSQPVDPALKHYGLDTRSSRPTWSRSVQGWFKRNVTLIAIVMSGGSQPYVPLIVVSPGSMAYTAEGVEAWGRLQGGESR